MEMKKGSGRLIGGLIVIALGGLFLLDSLDILDFGEIIGWAVSVALILFGLGLLVTRKFRQLFAPIVLIIVGVLLLLNNLGVDSWRFWPVILILVGGSIIFGGSRRRSRNRKRDAEGNSTDKSASATTSTEGEVNVSCTLGETNERIETSDFTGGTVNVTLGNVNVDLRDATIINRPAALDVSLTMAGLNLRVPSDWAVAMETDVTMGESEDKRTRNASTSDTPHLIITGSLTMANLAIDD